MKKKIISAMTKKERIQAAIRGEEVDRVPYSLWTHLPVIDLDPVSNASIPTISIKNMMWIF